MDLVDYEQQFYTRPATRVRNPGCSGTVRRRTASETHWPSATTG